MVVKEGRFGPYVTDGTTNASLRKGDAVESIDIDRASELLAERRAAGPSTCGRKAGTKKTAAQKVPAKKTTAKKTTAKKAPAKKATAKKAAGNRTRIDLTWRPRARSICDPAPGRRPPVARSILRPPVG